MLDRGRLSPYTCVDVKLCLNGLLKVKVCTVCHRIDYLSLLMYLVVAIVCCCRLVLEFKIVCRRYYVFRELSLATPVYACGCKVAEVKQVHQRFRRA